MQPMFCNRCGRRLPPGLTTCPTCGASVDATVALEGLDSWRSQQSPGSDNPDTADHLLVVRGPNAGSRFWLRGTLELGRAPDSDIFLDDISVSRRHAAIKAGTHSAVLTDHASLNGTFVNGERIETAWSVRSGDRIQVGRFLLVVQLGAEPG